MHIKNGWTVVSRGCIKKSLVSLYWYSVFGQPQSLLLIRKGLKFLKEKALGIIPKHGRTEAQISP